ncbi:hypothetical protein ACIP1G_22885 [Pseudomonas sp. NPDC089392]|uniref:hypothetical protein n=1 Tax=Pseudomonas sp. NPDC089392 TaxID=3364459 RepID=UPI003803ED34
MVHGTGCAGVRGQVRSGNRYTWDLSGATSVATGNSISVTATTTSGPLNLGNASQGRNWDTRHVNVAGHKGRKVRELHQTARNLNAFGELEIPVAERWALIGGAAWLHQKREVDDRLKCNAFVSAFCRGHDRGYCRRAGPGQRPVSSGRWPERVLWAGGADVKNAYRGCFAAHRRQAGSHR